MDRFYPEFIGKCADNAYPGKRGVVCLMLGLAYIITQNDLLIKKAAGDGIDALEQQFTGNQLKGWESLKQLNKQGENISLNPFKNI